MKKLLLVMVGLLLTAGCAAQGMNMQYMAAVKNRIGHPAGLP